MHLEGHPSDDQKERLEDFLTELMCITRKYGILLMDGEETVELLDLQSGTYLGIGLAFFTAPRDAARIVGYVPSDSILDGTWLVDGVDGPIEQRLVQNVFPVRDPL